MTNITIDAPTDATIDQVEVSAYGVPGHTVWAPQRGRLPRLLRRLGPVRPQARLLNLPNIISSAP